MKILFIHQYFKTPEEGGGIRSYHMASELVARGFDVTVITAHNKSGYIRKMVNGVEVHYLPIAYDNSFGFLQRVSSFLRFTFRSIRLAGRLPNVHLAYVITTPLSTAFVALYLKRFARIPYVFEVGDLWPEVPVKIGILKNPFLKACAYWLENMAYQNAAGIIALSPGIAAYIQKKVSSKPIAVIPNISDIDYFQPVDQEEKKEGLRILYCGALGVANHLEFLLAVAKACEKRKLPIQFTIVGEGARHEAIAEHANTLANVTLLGFVNRQELRKIIDRHDAFYVSFLKVPVLHTGSPNKYFDGLAAGKLMIINLGGWLKELTEQHGCGFAYDPERPEDFITMIEPYLRDPALLKKAQLNARLLATQYSVKHSADKAEMFLRQMIKPAEHT